MQEGTENTDTNQVPGAAKLAETKRLEAEIAEVCGVLNAAAARLVSLVAQALQTGAWEGWGIHSPEQWLGWRAGLSPARARRLVAMARRVGELPTTREAFEAGELSEDQVSVICRHTPAAYDSEVATFARAATVSQLSRTLSRYVFGDQNDTERSEDKSDEPPAHDQPPEDQVRENRRRVSFHSGEDGWWHLSALLPPEEGALVERALALAREAAFAEGAHDDPTATNAKELCWADALVRLAENFLASPVSPRPAYDRHLVNIHIEEGAGGATASHFHLGPALPEVLRRQLSCDARGRVVIRRGGVVVNVGRTQRIVPNRTRLAVEERDRGCRVPGCERTRWLQCHHVVHWEDGGTTDTANLVALCSRHHRLHHQGKLGIAGDADDPDGLVFTDPWGRTIEAAGRPTPPGDPPVVAARRLGLPLGEWRHPVGERLEGRWVWFGDAPGRAS